LQTRLGDLGLCGGGGVDRGNTWLNGRGEGLASAGEVVGCWQMSAKCPLAPPPLVEWMARALDAAGGT
jgi:hypothetical protein